jgi:hypothetical protein
MEIILMKLGFANLFVVDSVDRSGGLAMLWKKDCSLVIQNYSRCHINANVTSAHTGFLWKLTGFYGHPNPTRRQEGWAFLKFIKDMSPSPWLYIGDFNEITNQSEKWGAAMRREAQMQNFKATLDECQLGDLGFQGSKFTWTNGRKDSGFMKEQLDHAVANGGWCSSFRDVGVRVLPGRSSDHKPLLLQFLHSTEPCLTSKRSFKFEAKWTLDEDYQMVV